jgi:osmotically-inducible protein OsmY
MLTLLLRKANGIEINLWLQLLALGLSVVLLFLMAYYFLVINRPATPPALVSGTALQSPEGEKRRADAALIAKIKSAISQTKRLYGHSIGVEYRNEQVVLSGEVPTEIDKELAANLAQESSGGKEVINQLRVQTNITPEATLQLGVIPHQELTVNVDDLELHANLRERLMTVPELKAQRIKIKVQNRVVTLTGTVTSEALKLRAEQLARDYPKVTSVINQLRLGSDSAPHPAASPASAIPKKEPGK